MKPVPPLPLITFAPRVPPMIQVFDPAAAVPTSWSLPLLPISSTLPVPPLARNALVEPDGAHAVAGAEAALGDRQLRRLVAGGVVRGDQDGVQARAGDRVAVGDRYGRGRLVAPLVGLDTDLTVGQRGIADRRLALIEEGVLVAVVQPQAGEALVGRGERGRRGIEAPREVLDVVDADVVGRGVGPGHRHRAGVELQDAAGLRLGESVGAADAGDVTLVPADASAVNRCGGEVADLDPILRDGRGLPGAGDSGVVDDGVAALPVNRDAVLLIAGHHVVVQRGRAGVRGRAGRGQADLDANAALAAVALRVTADLLDRAVAHGQFGAAEHGHAVDRVVADVGRPATLEGETGDGHVDRSADVHDVLVGLAAAVHVATGRAGRAGRADHGHWPLRLELDPLRDDELLVVGARAHLDGVAGAGRVQC